MTRLSRCAAINAGRMHRTGQYYGYTVAASTSFVAMAATVTIPPANAYSSSGVGVIIPHSGTVTLTQQAQFSRESKQTTSTASKAVLRNGVTSGGLLVLMVLQGTTTGRTVSGCGATWARAVTATGGSLVTDIWIGRNPTAGQTTVTVTDTAASSPQGVLSEFSGCNGSISTWTTSNNTVASGASGGTMSTGNLGSTSPPAVGDLCVGMVVCNRYTDTAGYPPPPGGGAATLAWSNTGTWTLLERSTN